MTPTILLLTPFTERFMQRLHQHFTVIDASSWPDILAGLQGQEDQVWAVITSAVKGVPDNVIQQLPQLKAISVRGVGLDQVNLALARDCGVKVSSTTGILSDCVADLAFSLLLAVSRQIPLANDFVRSGQWQNQGFPLASRVNRKRIGILGLGAIGSLIAQRAAGFDMEIAYYGRRAKSGVSYAFFDDVQALAAWADYLVVAVPGGSQTDGLISAAVLEALGPSGVLVNIARGSVVDEQALLEALRNKVIADAGLDVYTTEPCPPQPWKDLDNVVLTPHIGSATRETRQAMEDLVLDNLIALHQQGHLLTPVD